MTQPMTFLDAAIASQTAAKARWDDLQAYQARFPGDASLPLLQAATEQAYLQARICYDMWHLHTLKVPPTIIRDWVRGKGWPC